MLFEIFSIAGEAWLVMFVLSVAISLIVAFFWPAQAKEGAVRSNRNGWDGVTWKKGSQDMMTPIVLPNDTYIPFYFTNVGSWAFPQFQTTVTGSHTVTVYWRDLYCAGDQMALYTTIKLGSRLLNFSFPASPPVGVASCDNFTLDPNVASSNPAFSTGSFEIGASVNNYTLVPVLSPFSAGMGVVKAVYT